MFKAFGDQRQYRLPHYDYSSEGAYFVTICTKNREDYFGKIRGGIMGLNEVGLVAHQVWTELPSYFNEVILDEFIVMPNHIHAILFISCRHAINRVPTGKANGGATGIYNPMGKGTLGEIIRSFKARITFEIRKKSIADFSWQPRFYDHVIRNETELTRIRKYIRNNPLKWELKQDDDYCDF